MKKILIAAFTFLLVAGNLLAQESAAPKAKKTPEARAEAFTKRMNKQLVLDQTQQERIKLINLERFKNLEAARATNAGNRKEVATKVKEINDNYYETLKGVLTPEQFTKFQELKEDMKEKAIARRSAKKG